jgi:hypothetical protein
VKTIPENLFAMMFHGRSEILLIFFFSSDPYFQNSMSLVCFLCEDVVGRELLNK